MPESGFVVSSLLNVAGFTDLPQTNIKAYALSFVCKVLVITVLVSTAARFMAGRLYRI